MHQRDRSTDGRLDGQTPGDSKDLPYMATHSVARGKNDII